MKKFTLLNNFLTTDARDGAIKIANSQKITKPIFNLISKVEYNEFIYYNNSEYLSIKINKESSNKINSLLKNSKNMEEDIKKILSDLEIYLSKTKIETLVKNSSDKNKVIELISKEYNASLKQINSLYIEAKKRKKEEGVWYLYLCHYFLKGRLNDGTSIKAPLVLIPIEIKMSDSKINLYKVDDPIYNEKLNLSLEENYGINLNSEFELALQNNGMLSISKILSIYKDVLANINVELNVNTDISNFVFDDVNDLSMINQLLIDYSSSISLIDPTGGKIKKDLLEILEKKENAFKTYSIMKTNDDIINKVIDEDSILEMNGTLNLYQKFAVASALEDNCIIYGPPGTGKSEVIANIVLNILNNNKSALIISEKKAALDVLHKRFKMISKLCLCAYDMNDSSSFYKKINSFQELIVKTMQDFKIEWWETQYKELKNNFNYLNKISNLRIHDADYSFIAKVLKNAPLVYDENTKDIFDEFNEIIESKKITIEEGYNLFLNLKELATNYREVLSLFIRNKFKFFDINDIDKLLDKFAKSKDKDFLISNYVLNGKVANKTIFNKKQEPLPIDINKIIDFLEKIKMYKIKKLNAYIFGKSSSFNIDLNYFTAGIIQKEISVKLEKNKYMLLQDDFIKYINFKINASSSNDEKIMNSYIKNFQLIYNSLSQPEKEEIDNLFAEAKMSKKPNVNMFASKYFNKLKLIFPIWLMNPSRCSIIVPNRKGIFDYGIFDEASQMFLERGFSMVYRAKINIIAGDDKQLKPTDFFQSRYDSGDDATLDDVESLLERAKLCMWPTYYLKNHYRCDSSDLISFSSENFYDNNLEFVTKNGCFDRAIDVIDVDGKWENEVNKIEVDKTIELIDQNKDKYKTIMVITLNKKQLDLVEKEFLKKFGSNNEIINKYDTDLISFKNLENSQGHEADMVILSIGYGFNKDNKLINSFGPITQKNGSNRLNVAITRAKTKMFVVKSFKNSDMKINTENHDAYIFYKYITYIDKLKSKKLFDQEDRDDKIKVFEKEALDYILKNLKGSYKINKNINLGSCCIDCAIFDEKVSKMLLGINFNKAYKVNDWKTTLDNLYRNKFISDRGYNIIDIDEIEWYFKKDIIIDIINKKISEFMG